MGLISFFKQIIYDNRLKKAGELLEEGRKEESLQAYNQLLGKHSEAAVILANIYFNDCKNSDTPNQLKLLKKILELPKLNGSELEWNKKDYYATRSKTISYLFSVAIRHITANRYWEAYSILNFLRAEKLTTHDALSYYIEACFGCVSTNVIIDYDSLKEVIENLSDKKNIFNTYDRFIPYVKRFSSEYLSYSCWFITQTHDNYPDLVEKFNRCWTLVELDIKQKNNYLETIINKSDIDLVRTLFRYLITNSEQYLQNDDTCRIIINWASSIPDFKESLSLLSELHSVGVGVQAAYEERLHTDIGKIELDERRNIIQQGLELYPHSTSILDDKHEFAKSLAKEKRYNEALDICNELINIHNQVALTTAKVYVCLADEEPDLDKKMDYLDLALNFTNTEGISKKEHDRVLSKIFDISINTSLSYFKTGNKKRAYEIVRNINTINSIKTLALFLANDSIEIETGLKLEYYRDSIKELKNYNYKEIFETEHYKKLWTELANIVIEKSSLSDHEESIKSLKQLLLEIETEIKLIENPASYSDVVDLINKELTNRFYLYARQKEIDGEIEDACDLYKEAKKYEGKSTPCLADFRYVICKLKKRNNEVSLEKGSIIESLLNKAPEAFAEERDEIAYRYALQLLRAGEVNKSSSIISQFIPNETSLKKACEQQFIINGLKHLNEFNDKLELIRNRQLSSDDAIYIVNHMLEFADNVKHVISIDRPTLSQYRKSIKNYAILKLFDDGKYDLAFEKLKKEHPDYLEDLTCLRNMAIVCLNMAEAGMITDDNYKEVISIWLTAIYQEKLFVKSLDYTTWDDQFTFSLANAYGHFDEDTIGSIPDNVNFDEPDGSNSNVAIKDVQQSLLNRFEAAIDDNNNYLKFFNEQKEAMDDFIDLCLDEKCRITAPFLAEESEDIFSEIESALDKDRVNHYSNYENVLAVGYKYGLRGEDYSDYHTASCYYDECTRVIEELESYQIVALAYNTEKVKAIKEYTNKWDSLIAFAKGKIASLSSLAKFDFERDYQSFYKICAALNDGSISFQYAIFVMQHVVSLVNDHKMSIVKAADYILPIYLLDVNNPRIKDNLTSLFEMLARENDSASKEAVLNILNKTRNADPSFYSILNSEYQQAKINNELNEIVDKVNDKTMNKIDALKRIYSLYESNSNNARLCQNLATLCDICIHEFIIQGNGSYDVENVLNSLIANKSSEFIKQSSVFKRSYNTIWNQLDFDNQMLLSDSPLSSALGKSLNSRGLALKKGLNYMKKLGGFDGNDLINNFLNSLHR